MRVTNDHIFSGTPMGATLTADGATFRIWAPRAREVFLVGQFSDAAVWTPRTDHALSKGPGGYWSGFRRGVRDGDHYKFWIVGEGSAGFKRDPYARELSTNPPYPNSNCVARDPDSYQWRTRNWRRPEFSDLIIYQLHVGTFAGADPQRTPGCFLDVIARLDYLSDLGVTALQLLPIVEFSSPRSLGYDGSDIFSPEMDYTLEGPAVVPYLGMVNAHLARAGATLVTASELAVPINQLKLLVDLCHLKGMAVLLDVVYNHAGYQVRGQDESIYFLDRARGADPNDSLYFMDRDHTGPVFAFWKSEVRQYLIDNADFFTREYRVDGLRFDQTSVIDTESIGSGWLFLQHCTSTVRATEPRACQIAEYWPRNPVVTESSPGGAGFDATWNDGVREAVRQAIATAAAGQNASVDLEWVARELLSPGFRDGWRAVNCVESHDEIYRDREARVARIADPSNSRSWYARSRARVATGLIMTAPGIPMLFMGQEILEDKNWSDDPAHHPETLVWWDGLTRGEKPMVDMHRYVRELVGLRRSLGALRYGQARVSHVDHLGRVLILHRWIEGRGEDVIVVACLREHTHLGYRIGLPRPGAWREIFNSDVYDNWVNPNVAGNGGEVVSEPIPWHGFGHSAELVVPANSLITLVPMAS